MKRRITHLYLRRVLFLIVCLAGFAGNNYLSAQEISSSVSVPSDTYEKVLNKLFPRSDKRDFTDGREFVLTLRYAPEESQINIIKLNDGSFAVSIYQVSAGSSSIYAQIKKLLEKDKTLDADALVSQIKITKQNVPVTVKVKKIIARFGLLRLSPQLEAGIILDAPQYDLEYETFSNKLHFQLLSNRQKSDRSEYPLIRWMNELRDVVLKP